MNWRLAYSLQQLRTEIDSVYPQRNKASDGAIGDAAHQNRSSDHNPWVPPPTGGVVTAIDITHDPDGGVDCDKLATYLRNRALAGDRRIKYIIWERRISSTTASWAWRAYNGINPHTRHLHLSVAPTLSLADDRANWGIAAAKTNPTNPGLINNVEHRWTSYYTGRAGSRVVRRWDCGKDVQLLQKFIAAGDDGYFGEHTEEQVKDYQRMRGLVADGIVGPKTWAPIVSTLGV